MFEQGGYLRLITYKIHHYILVIALYFLKGYNDFSVRILSYFLK